MDVKKFLSEWAIEYFKSRDIIEKKIVSIDEVDDGIVIHKKDGDYKVNTVPELSINVPEGEVGIITLNNRKNVETLYSNWSKFCSNPGLKIYFINPFSTTDKKWVINPCVHTRICDGATLRLGLISMFETVEPLTEEILSKKMAVQS